MVRGREPRVQTRSLAFSSLRLVSMPGRFNTDAEAMADNDDLRSINLREAKSGRVRYTDPILLHESSKQRIVMVPFFIPRTCGVDLAVKIQTYRKAAPPNDWVLVEHRSVSLREAAGRRLLLALKNHLAVADDGASENYILVRVSEGTAQLGEHDPAAVAGAPASGLSQPEIIQHLAQDERTGELVNAIRGAIRLKEMRAAVAALRQHLAAGEAREDVYQKWCEEHSWAFGNAYVLRDEVRDISAGDRLDLLLPTVISGYRDIVELKRSDVDVLLYDASRRTYYFSAEVSKAIGQCHRYLDVLHEAAAKGLRDHPEIVAYHPRAIIVIGRAQGWSVDQLKALHGLNSRLAGITVMTYDQLLAQGERLVQLLGEQQEAAAPHSGDSPPEWDWDPEKELKPSLGELIEIDEDDPPF